MAEQNIAKSDFRELVGTNSYNCSLNEYQYIGGLIQQHSPGNVLVFGVGYDSSYWIRFNQGGTTWFLEDNPEWANRIQNQIPDIQVKMVTYPTKRRQWRRIMNQPERLCMNLSDIVPELYWDVIFIDAPIGSNGGTPGRMQSIYSASKLKYRHILVHDCNRTVERKYFKKFIGEPDHIIDKLYHKDMT